MKKEAKHTPGPILNDGETPKGLMLLAGPEDREDEYWSCGPTEGEEIMVNTPYDVFILPLRPSGLNGNAPRFVVHVPQIEAQRPTGDGCHCATCTCEPNMTPAVRFDLSPAQKEGAIREHLIRLGWTPPDEHDLSQPAEQQAKVEALRAEVGAMREALEDIRSRSSIDFLAMRSYPFEITAMLGDIHQIAGAALAKENSND